MLASPQQERELMLDLWDRRLADDLLRFVLYIYPWGQPGTPLEHFTGPRKWQCEDLDEISQHIADNKNRVELGLLPTMFRKATASGRGPGKSALVAWISHWFRSTRLGSTNIVTANTEPQLKTRTFAEINKWMTLAINGHWFESTVLSVKPAKWFDEALKRDLKIDTGYYYTQGQLWSEENPDAFAGVHNPNGVLVQMDEASGIPNSIFTVTEGFFTEPTPNRYWFVYSNPRRNSGAFYEIFHVEGTRQRWRHRNIDIRTVEGIDPAMANGLIAQYGIDHDAVRVEVLGQFPKQGSRQFIPNESAYNAQHRGIITDAGSPLILGVDVARFGDDYSVARFRQGPDARGIPPVRWKGMDTVASADKVAYLIDTFNPDGVCIDAGQGTGVIDILRRKGYRVHEVWFGSKSDQPEWGNKRTEMYALAREWLSGGCLDASADLFTDLTAVEYDYFGKAKDQVILESKEALKDRIGRSPDDGDALALTFAKHFARRDLHASRYRSKGRFADGMDDSPFTV